MGAIVSTLLNLLSDLATFVMERLGILVDWAREWLGNIMLEMIKIPYEWLPESYKNYLMLDWSDAGEGPTFGEGSVFDSLQWSVIQTYLTDIRWILPLDEALVIATVTYALCAVIRLIRFIIGFVPTIEG